MQRYIALLTALALVLATQARAADQNDLVQQAVDTALQMRKTTNRMERARQLSRLSEQACRQAREAARHGRKRRAENLALAGARIESEGVHRQLQQMEESALLGEEDTAADEVLGRSRRNLEVLTDLLDKVPEPARKGIMRAIENAQRTHGKAHRHMNQKRRQAKLKHQNGKGGKPDHAGSGNGNGGKPDHVGPGNGNGKGGKPDDVGRGNGDGHDSSGPGRGRSGADANRGTDKGKRGGHSGGGRGRGRR